MTQSRFFQLSLFFPGILWVLGLLVFSFANRQGYDFIIKHMFDAFRVFLPYLIFAAVIWKLVRDKTYRQLVLIAFVIPIVWGVFFTLCYIVHSYLMDPMVDKNVLWMMAFWATFVAYLIEVIPFIVLSVFKGDFASAASLASHAVPFDRDPSPNG
jgi:hypothetical protein